ncbi:MAG: hypothetical protein HYV63_14620 [Candidatus Schekmanbacteria bacterium]|nr:hypothetical protein [Candidatus Schekmanbacteria bacterium]
MSILKKTARLVLASGLLLSTSVPFAAAGQLNRFALTPSKEAIEFIANPGEANDIQITASGTINNWIVRFDDPAAVIGGPIPGGCVHPFGNPNVVVCQSIFRDLEVHADLGDLDDVLLWTDSTFPKSDDAAVIALGGSGDDVLESDPASTFALTFDGGIDHDTLIGSDSADTLRGSGGDDLIDGRGGEDTLQGGFGKDELRANDGGTADLVHCGFGVDTFAVDGADTTVMCP